MDRIKLRFKVGIHEFEAEGPADVVDAYFKLWKSDTAGRKDEVPPDKGAEKLAELLLAPAIPPKPIDLETPDAFDWKVPKSQLAQLFAVDDKRGIVRLRAVPSGDGAEGKAALLVLYGTQRLRGEDEVLATRLLTALESSGVRPGRIDRAAATELRERLITKSGTGKGNRYRLTSTGITKAEEIAGELAKQFS